MCHILRQFAQLCSLSTTNAGTIRRTCRLLGAIYPKEGGADSDQEELLSPFQVRIGSTVKVQSPGEFTCGAWCCQFLAWYLENPDFDLEEKVPTNPSERRALLADFISTTEQAMSRYSSLSWPTTD